MKTDLEKLREIQMHTATRGVARCKSCRYVMKEQTFWYCGLQKSFVTGNGRKKIKANDNVCALFEKETYPTFEDEIQDQF